jgi:hypothetical protein
MTSPASAQLDHLGDPIGFAERVIPAEIHADCGKRGDTKDQCGPFTHSGVLIEYRTAVVDRQWDHPLRWPLPQTRHLTGDRPSEFPAATHDSSLPKTAANLTRTGLQYKPVRVLSPHIGERADQFLYRGVCSCVQNRASSLCAPANPRDRNFPTGTKLSLDGFPQSPKCFGRSRRRLSLPSLPRLTNEQPSDGCAANTNRHCQSFSRSSTRCFANRQNLIFGRSAQHRCTTSAPRWLAHAAKKVASMNTPSGGNHAVNRKPRPRSERPQGQSRPLIIVPEKGVSRGGARTGD